MDPPAPQQCFSHLPLYEPVPHPRKRPQPVHKNPSQEPAVSFTPVNRRLSPSPSPAQRINEEEGDEGDDEEEEEDSFNRPAILRRGRHVKRYERILAAHNLAPLIKIQYTLRVKHQAVLSTLLHRCVLEKDWERASRAFGLLVRQKHVDLRRIWSVGLDILLWRREADSLDPGTGPAEDDGHEESPKRRHIKYNPENVSKAIEYLNRLILSYPFTARQHSYHPSISAPTTTTPTASRKSRKNNPHPHLCPSAVDFYPVLFSLLIRTSPYSDTMSPPPLLGVGIDTLSPHHPERIKEEIESLMLTPPWSDMQQLWLMKGMICLWLADLEEGRRAKNDDNDDDGDGDLELSDHPKDDKNRAIVSEKSNELRKEAAKCFESVRKMGGEVPEEVENGDWKILDESGYVSD